MLARRILILLAVLMGVSLLAAALAPPDMRLRERQPGQARTPTPSPAPAPAARPAPAQAGASPDVDAQRTLSADPGRPPRRVVAALGDRVRIVVTSTATIDSVTLGELRAEALDPSSPATFELLADARGEYPIRLVDADRLVGTLVVR